MTPCVCGQPTSLPDCCGRFHRGELPQTAEQLMRARYAAFALGEYDFLASTQLAPFTRPHPQHWVGLAVHEATQTEVEFTARWVEGEREMSLHERSRFERRDGRWLYVDGVPRVEQRRLGRNGPCPCGSGKKLKACAGR